MPGLQHKDQEAFVLDGEHDPVLAHPEPVDRRSGESGQFPDVHVWIVPESGDGPDDPASRLGGEPHMR